MQIVIAKLGLLVALEVLLLATAGGALGASHTWDINEVFSNADGSVQFIEFRETEGAANETLLPNQLVSSDSQNFQIGGGPIFPPTSNRHFLLATPAFASLPGAPTPDAIIPAGSLPFFSAAGDTIVYSIYDSLSFGSVPTDGVDSLHRVGGQAVNSPTNYAGESGQVDASPAPSVPALGGRGIALVAGLLALAGVAFARRPPREKPTRSARSFTSARRP